MSGRDYLVELLLDNLAESKADLSISIQIFCVILPGRKVFGVEDQITYIDSQVVLFINNDSAVLIGNKTQFLKVVIFLRVLDAVLSSAIRLAISSEHFSVLVPLQVVVEDLVVQPLVLAVQLGIGEDPGLQQVIAEALSSLQVAVDVGQGGPERLQHHLPVLLSYDLIPDPTGRVNALLPDCLHFRQNLSTLGLEDALEDAGCIVDQVRQCLVVGALRRHVDGLLDQLVWVLTLSFLTNFLHEILDFLRRHEVGQLWV